MRGERNAQSVANGERRGRMCLVPCTFTVSLLYNHDMNLCTHLYSTRWLPGFARVPYYAPSPCHMHPVHNCQHIKACHPPDKQYIMTYHNTEFIIYTCSLFFICNTKVARARAAMWDGL